MGISENARNITTKILIPSKCKLDLVVCNQVPMHLPKHPSVFLRSGLMLEGGVDPRPAEHPHLAQPVADS